MGSSGLDVVILITDVSIRGKKIEGRGNGKVKSSIWRAVFGANEVPSGLNVSTHIG